MDWQESTKNKMLRLELPTDPRWVDIASISLEAILVDHAYCEQKAASSCISLIIKFPEFDEMVDVLSLVVAEEWQHFESVMQQIRKRGFKFGFPRKDNYVVQLQSFVRKGGSRKDQVSELLLMNALIEARSCERFKLLSKNLEDEELSAFYHELMISEAGHYVNFIQLAKKYQDPEKVERRWQEWLNHEKNVMKDLEVRGDRMH
ncbi:tRNA-(ms[2]io[6]A)-hydroxylase [Cyclobacterium sp. 1_MG-2023]|uniref:tRNA-(ms[2]io[6]A)-hydroxylase n=1 Tax=Cyclobacterium sp. 1_MG-2023 TaxID=3062681 RepID=UPI0026E1E667|nr:tRNA-(ms[2]io[6]A)-hydroxylase [Cyclobacterium sp. 1_MG-2023]MDO6437163.1 tRNA-(ms[2]io[6]A)-hydroxylase [Cyclobacterium sp. 1_MG-2023]